jgi:hypothetical protein
MNINDYVKQFNKPYNEVKTVYAEEFKSMWDYENKWYQPLEKKTDLIKDPNDRLSIEKVISKIRDSNYIFTEDDTESLSAFTSNINTLVRIANRINNFREGVALDNGTTLNLFKLFNLITVTPRLDSLRFPLNKNLDSFLPHLF